MLHISSRPMEGEALSQLGGRLRDLPLLLGGAASEKEWPPGWRPKLEKTCMEVQQRLQYPPLSICSFRSNSAEQIRLL